MTLTLARAPKSGPLLLAHAIQGLGVTKIAAAIDKDQAAFIRRDLEVDASRPVAIYHATLEQLTKKAGPRTSAFSRIGWRYLLLQEDRLWVADLRVHGRRLRFGRLIAGEVAERFAVACRLIETMAELDGEVRLLTAPLPAQSALWVAGWGPSIFVDLAGADELVASDREYLTKLAARVRTKASPRPVLHDYRDAPNPAVRR